LLCERYFIHGAIVAAAVAATIAPCIHYGQSVAATVAAQSLQQRLPRVYTV
jgi:transposase